MKVRLLTCVSYSLTIRSRALYSPCAFDFLARDAGQWLRNRSYVAYLLKR
jgi:hypothetical protein